LLLDFFMNTMCDVVVNFGGVFQVHFDQVFILAFFVFSLRVFRFIFDRIFFWVLLSIFFQFFFRVSLFLLKKLIFSLLKMDFGTQILQVIVCLFKNSQDSRVFLCVDFINITFPIVFLQKLNSFLIFLVDLVLFFF
jgi:hypothetical protein